PKYYPEEKALAMVDDMTWWYTQDKEISLEPEIATDVLIQMSDPRSRHFATMRHETLPPDHLFGRRLEVLTLAVISQLRAKANWHRIAREWAYGAEPVTALGREAAEIYGHPRVGAQGLGRLVAAHRCRLHAPHQTAAADGLFARRERVDRHCRTVRGDQAR